VGAFLWTRHRPDDPIAAQGQRDQDRTMVGTLVYASADGDGVTGRLWFLELATNSVVPGPRTVLPDQIVASVGDSLAVRSGNTAYLFSALSPRGIAFPLAQGQFVEWAPEGRALFVVTREPSARGRCPVLSITRTDATSRESSEVYRRPSCSTVEGLATDGLSRPFVSLAGPTNAGVYELGYRKLHLVVPDFAMLSVSPVGDMLVGPRIKAPTGPAGVAAPILRTLLVWQGVGGPTVIGTAHADLRAERLLAWSSDGHRAAVLGTLGGVRSIWVLKAIPGEGRQKPRRVAPELPPQVDSVGAAFLGDSLIVSAAGKVYVVLNTGFRELELPEGAPPPSGPLLWRDDWTVRTGILPPE
jgi:hypothetical protein